MTPPPVARTIPAAAPPARARASVPRRTRRRLGQTSGRRPPSVGILAQDRLLQLAQRLPRLDAELLDEAPPRLAVDSERLGLPPRPIEGEHLLSPHALSQGMLRRKGLELRDQPVVVAEGELGLDPLLGRHQPQLLEAVDISSGERLVREVGQGLAAPERERLRERSQRLLRPALRIQAATGLQESIEATGVDVLRVDPERVTAVARDDHVVWSQHLP